MSTSNKGASQLLQVINACFPSKRKISEALVTITTSKLSSYVCLLQTLLHLALALQLIELLGAKIFKQRELLEAEGHLPQVAMQRA